MGAVFLLVNEQYNEIQSAIVLRIFSGRTMRNRVEILTLILYVT